MDRAASLWKWISCSICNCAGGGFGDNLKFPDAFFWLLHANRADLLTQDSVIIALEAKDYIRIFSLVEQFCGAPILLYGCEETMSYDCGVLYLPLLTYLFSLYSVLQNAPKELACTNWSNAEVSRQLKIPIFRQILSTNNNVCCSQCGKCVKIFERFIVDSQVRHRQCFTCIKCNRLLYVGLYKISVNDAKCRLTNQDKSATLNYECLEHEKDEFMAKFTTKSPIGGALELVKNDDSETLKLEEVEGRNDGVLPEPAGNKDRISNNQEPGEFSALSTEDHLLHLNEMGRMSDLGSEVRSEMTSQPAIVMHERSDEIDRTPCRVTESFVDDGRFRQENIGQLDAVAAVITKKIEIMRDRPKAPPRIKKKLLNAMKPASEDDSGSVKCSSDQRTTLDYPEDLNPFEIDPIANASESLNPFLSDDEDELSLTSSVSSWNICEEPVSDRSIEFTFKEHKGHSSTHMLNSLVPSGSSRPVSSQSGRLSVQSSKTLPPVSGLAAESENSSSARSSGRKRPAPKPPHKQTTQPLAESKAVSATPKICDPNEKDGLMKIEKVCKGSSMRFRKKRPAPPPPLPLRRQIVHDSTLNVEEILFNFDKISGQFCDLEKRGEELESKITENFSIEIAEAERSASNQTIENWLTLCEERMNLLQKQSEYAFLLREKQLNDIHTEVEYQLRCLIEKPESLKVKGDDQKETYLLQKLLSIIEEKSRLTESCAADSMLQNRKIDLSGAEERLPSTSDLVQGKREALSKNSKTKKILKSRLKNLRKKLGKPITDKKK